MVEKFIFYPQWMTVLEKIYFKKKTFISKLVKDLGLNYTYSHINNIVHALERRDLINLQKKGRQQIISLTKLGRETGSLVNRLKSKLNNHKKSV